MNKKKQEKELIKNYREEHKTKTLFSNKRIFFIFQSEKINENKEIFILILRENISRWDLKYVFFIELCCSNLIKMIFLLNEK